MLVLKSPWRVWRFFGNLKREGIQQVQEMAQGRTLRDASLPPAGFACLPADQIENNGPRKSHRDQYQKHGDLIDWHIVL
jgi:hypothetical protein